MITDEQLRGVRINSAIEDGLRFLWVNQTNRATNFPNGVITNWGSSYPQSFAALVVLAFENHDYQLPNSDDAPTGLYEKYVVRRGLNYVIDELRQIDLTVQAAGDPCVNVDDGRRRASACCQNQQQEGYATSLAILPLAASNALDSSRHRDHRQRERRLRRRQDLSATCCSGMINALAWGQGESGFARGGWAYTFNAGNTDGSTIGWNVLALLDAEAAGITVPAFVKTEFINFAIPYGLEQRRHLRLHVGQQPGVATTSANMARPASASRRCSTPTSSGSATHACWPGATRSAPAGTRRSAGDSYPCGHGTLHNKGCGYAMFNVFKASEAPGHHDAARTSTGRPGPGTIPANDWYADYVDWLLANQTAPTSIDRRPLAGLVFSCCGDRRRSGRRGTRGTDPLAGRADRARPDAVQHGRPRPDDRAAARRAARTPSPRPRPAPAARPWPARRSTSAC